MHETMAFDRAISRATELVNFEDTLVVVTADHGHVMTMAGYPTRGADIRGTIFDKDNVDELALIGYIVEGSIRPKKCLTVFHQYLTIT